MLTNRDIEVIRSIGEYRTLTSQQIIKLHFPSYATFQRRLRRELIPNRYVKEPFYLQTERLGERIPTYQLGRKGKKLYNKKYKGLKLNPHYLFHFVEVNRILIYFKRLISSFKHEYREGSVQMDAFCRFKNGEKVSFEIDLSEKESKYEIQRQYKNYEDIQIDKLFFFSNRADKIANWVDEVADSDLEVYCVKRENKYMRRVLNSF